MANVVINDAHLNDIAAAIRAKNGSTDTYKPSEMAAAISAIENTGGSGGIVTFADFMARTLQGDISVDCPTIGIYGLACNEKMTSLTSTATTIETCGCIECIRLTTVVMNNLISIGDGAFSGCSKLASIQIPMCKTIGEAAFDDCDALQTFVAPSVETIAGMAIFNGCRALTKIDFTNLSSVSVSAFQGANNLNTVIIRNTNAVPTTPHQGPILPDRFRSDSTSETKGYIYVPAAMIDAYTSYATTGTGYDIWSMMNYRAIEDYPEICG